MSNRAEEVANAVLYEGYILYPYRPSSVKNQQRWNFGVVYPPGSGEGASSMQTQCLAAVNSNPVELDVKVRFLHLMTRTVPESPEGVQRNTKVPQSWQEGVEREIFLTRCRLDEILDRPLQHEFAFPASRTTEPARDSGGDIIYDQQPISGVVEVAAESAGADLFRLTICIRNLSAHPGVDTRDSILLRSLVSVHKILTLRGGEFVSLIDPPEFYKRAAGECQNAGTWPVLAGDEGQRDVMLSSPIILYDYPQIAPESAGELCDGTEIDEILSLRILTLTDEEKREMRQSDERGRRILERTESLPEEQWLKLHGVLRGLRPSSEVTQ